MSRAIVVGSNGQDGRLLFDQLAAKGCGLLGIARGEVRGAVEFCPQPLDLNDPAAVASVVQSFNPDQIYYLAAYHHSSQNPIPQNARDLMNASYEVHVAGLLNFLQAIVDHAPRARLFYAASSRVFGDPPAPTQDELTPMNPLCPYGITKAAGVQACRLFRRNRAAFAAVGILYNHESPLRGSDFVSKKIIRAAVRIRNGGAEPLVLGDLAARADWGWAPDYVQAMTRILALPVAEDFIVASGESHTVRQFVEEAFGQLGLDWTKHVVEDPSLVRHRRGTLTGDASRLARLTGWKPSVSFPQMIGRLLESEQEMISSGPKAAPVARASCP